MRGLNKVTLIGNLGKDPEVQTLDGIVAWRNLADLAGKYLTKGSHIYLEGKIKTRSYEDKNGNKKYITEIIADSFIMLDKPADKAEINANS